MPTITSPLAGTVLEVLVQTGGMVDAETDVVLLESMKMEIPVAAEAAGRITEIKVIKGDQIREGQVLIVLG